MSLDWNLAYILLPALRKDINFTTAVFNRYQIKPNFTFFCHRYSENAKKLSKAYRDRPSTPLETAVWWTEYLGRGNALPYVRSEAANMSWCQRNLIDVMLVLALLALLSIYLSFKVLKYILTRCKKERDGRNDGTSSKKRD